MSIEVTARGIVIPADELFWRFSRSSGPGGQSVNTTDSRAELSFNVARSEALPPLLKERALSALAGQLADGVITVTAAENRSQLRNREAAAARLSGRPRRPRRRRRGPGGRPGRPAARASAAWRPSSSGRRPSGCAARPRTEPAGGAARAAAQYADRVPGPRTRRDRPVLNERDRRRRELSQNYLRSAAPPRSSCGTWTATRPGCAWR